MYPFSISLAVIGAVLLIPSSKTNRTPEKLILLAWLAASLFIGLVQRVNINRIDLVFIPLILCIAVFMYWLGNHNRLALAVLLMVYLVSFYTFNNVYQGNAYQKDANGAFFAGLIPALDQARLEENQPICVTDHVNMPYIYVLFTEKMNPSLFIQAVKYVYPDTHSGLVLSLGRYYFGMANCPKDTTTTYILTGETPPENGITYQVENFTNFHVYYPVNRTP
jgi:flagellar biosynthesis protein FliQ